MSSLAAPPKKVATQMTLQHKVMLATLVLTNKELILGKLTPTVTNKKKDAKWHEIYAELSSHGAVIESVKHLRDVNMIINNILLSIILSTTLCSNF
jgi:hypothetical protein